MLDPRHCAAFVAVIESGSFDAAAKRLNLSASAVTQRVQGLEQRLGQVLLTRAKPCIATFKGQQLYDFLKNQQRQEQQLLDVLLEHSASSFKRMCIATNADSLATWLLPVLSRVLQQEQIVIDTLIDDQSKTYQLLEKGQVHACVSMQSTAMKGCYAEYLGKMRYQLMATRAFQEKWFAHGLNRERLKQAPAVIFNQHDQLHVQALARHFALYDQHYPHHVIPSSESFLTAIRLGLGYGFVPTLQIQSLAQHDTLVVLAPELDQEVPLYWHYWQQQAAHFQRVTTHICHAARQVLVSDEAPDLR